MLSEGETALCSAVLALIGTDTMVSLIPRPVPGHQRLDARRSPLGARSTQRNYQGKKFSSLEDRVIEDLLYRPSEVHTHVVVRDVSLDCFHRCRHQFIDVTFTLLVARSHPVRMARSSKES